MNLHDHLKILKHGYSKVLDHACREIRYKRITREQALVLVEKYQFNRVENLGLFCEWLSINLKSLNFVVNRFRNKLFWNEIDIDKWKFNGISYLLKRDKLKKSSIRSISKNFIKNYAQNKCGNKYIYFGKGFEE
tara:strand:- start:110 stop:511 length:402 start_codon:yes stop_codon:yes gene_type:complete